MVSLVNVVMLAWAALVGAAVQPPPAPAFAPRPAAAGVPRPIPSAATQTLRGELARLIRMPGRASFGVMVVSLDRGDTLFAQNADVPLAPASNMKLYTTTAALYYLGPDYRYNTYVLATGGVRQGVVNGDLVLYGTGDPSLSFRFHGNSARPMRELADSLVARGVRQVRGDVVGDASYFRGAPAGATWDASYMNASYAVPSSALSLNENLVTVRVSPGPTVGSPARVEGLPGGTWLAVDNQATTTAAGGTSIDVRRWAYDGPIVVRGHIRRGAGPVTRLAVAADPAQYAAAALLQALSERGVEVTGRARGVYEASLSPVTGHAVFASAFGRGAPLHVVTVLRSPPLIDILDILMHLSHNMFAEQTLRTVGRVALDDGSVAGGHRAILSMLDCETGPDTAGLLLDQLDGSGLSPGNRTSPRTMIRLLGFAARAPFFDALWQTLPEAGHRHLRRMFQTAAYNNLRAKTGTIDNVSALSGYVRAADGERLAFSIISNGDRSTWRAKRVEDAIGARLAAFNRPAGAVATPVEPGYQAVAAGPPARRPQATAAPAPAVATSLPFWHTVSRGETVSGIARRYGTTVAALRRANPGLSPRRIRPGQKLRLPAGTSAPARSR